MMATIEVLTHSELESKVLQAPGPVALDFYQASCAPCRALSPRLERIGRQYADHLPVYRMDIDRDVAVAERFGVSSIPTVLVLRAGKEVESTSSCLDSELPWSIRRCWPPSPMSFTRAGEPRRSASTGSGVRAHMPSGRGFP